LIALLDRIASGCYYVRMVKRLQQRLGMFVHFPAAQKEIYEWVISEAKRQSRSRSYILLGLVVEGFRAREKGRKG
jgi:hypothetical protein